MSLARRNSIGRRVAGNSTLRILAISLILIASVRGAAALECAHYPERVVLDALLNYDFGSAGEATLAVSQGHVLIDSTSFYRGLVSWVEAAITENPDQKDRALATLVKAVEQLQTDYQEAPEAENLLGWHLAAAHTARLLLENEQILSGYSLGRKSASSLATIVYNEEFNREQRAAAALATGLFYVYSNFIPDEFGWVKSMVKSEGSIDQGRQLIEFSIRHSPQFSPEAARALFMEVPWTTPLHCRYLNLAEQMAQYYPNNTDFSIVLQGSYLRCGYPELALYENERIQSLSVESMYQGLTGEPYAELMTLGKVRALAQIGRARGIEEYLENTSSNPLYTYAMANALDVSGKRNQALQHYKSLGDDPDTAPYIRKNARARLTTPYHPPETIQRVNSLNLLTCTQ